MKHNRESLSNLIAPLSTVVSRLTLGHFLLAADGKNVSATAYSESMSLTMREPSDQTFAACPDYAATKAALSGLTGGDATFALETNQLTVSARGKRLVRCIPAKDFPATERPTGEPVMFDGNALKDALNFVKGCVGNDPSRQQIMGVHLDGSTVVATNGNVMRWISIDANLPKMTVPTASVNTLVRVLGPGAHSVAAGKRAEFVFGGGELQTSLIESQYPPYERVIPDDSGRAMVVHADEMLRAVSAVAVFAEGKTKGMTIEMSGENVTLSCAAADEPLDVVSWEGGDHKVLLNALLLADMLTAFGKEEVTIRFKDDVTAPLLFKDKQGRSGVLMPWRQ